MDGMEGTRTFASTGLDDPPENWGGAGLFYAEEVTDSCAPGGCDDPAENLAG